MSNTQIDPAAVAAFTSKGEDVRSHMRTTLQQTQRSVEEAISPATWGGQASSAFGDVTARYQSASVKLNNHMEEILNSVKSGAQKLGNSDESNSHSIKSLNF